LRAAAIHERASLRGDGMPYGNCRMVEGGFGAEIGSTVDGHRARELGLVVG